MFLSLPAVSADEFESAFKSGWTFMVFSMLAGRAGWGGVGWGRRGGEREEGEGEEEDNHQKLGCADHMLEAVLCESTAGRHYG